MPLLKLLLLGFIAGFLSTLIFHQGLCISSIKLTSSRRSGQPGRLTPFRLSAFLT
jgi:hypothetical protein